MGWGGPDRTQEGSSPIEPSLAGGGPWDRRPWGACALNFPEGRPKSPWVNSGLCQALQPGV